MIKKESSLEYKQRVMDLLSPTFCAAKWNNATIWLDWGQTTSCHHPEPHAISIKEILKNPSAIHNTERKKNDRKLMLEGKRPKGCQYCWNIEDMGKDNVSDRVFKTIIYKEESLKELTEISPETDVDLKTLEISFDRKCNFACSYCGPHFSTHWAADIKRAGPYTDIKDIFASNYEHDYDFEFPYEDSPINPYSMAFWKWWPRLSETLQELRVTGGEPLLSPNFWELVKLLQQTKREKMDFAVNSNLGLSDHYIDKLIESSHKIDNFHLYTSCETSGAQAEYIRDGLDYERFCRNIEKVAEHGRFKSINMMMTINALCLFGITDFLDRILYWKNKFGAHQPTFTMNVLQFPSFMSVLTLPDHLKEATKQKLNKWYKANRENPLLLGHEKDSTERLINYLHIVQQASEKSSPREIAQKDLKSFFEQYDKRRKKSILETFPREFGDWYKTIPSHLPK
jgi:organic radical activating enzyme